MSVVNNTGSGFAGSRAAIQAPFDRHRFDTGQKPCAPGDWAFSPRAWSNITYLQILPEMLVFPSTQKHLDRDSVTPGLILMEGFLRIC